MQLVTLCALKPGESTPMNMISCLLVCDASNVTGIVERLVSRKLIIREESQEDRRVKVIHTTLEGEVIRGEVLNEITDHQPESLSGLTPVEYEELNHLLRKALLPKA
jgi:DNA-binding MarR family transcriptional regulator